MAEEKIIGIDLGTTNSVVSVLEGGEPCDGLPSQLERGHPVGDALLGVWHDRQDRAA